MPMICEACLDKAKCAVLKSKRTVKKPAKKNLAKTQNPVISKKTKVVKKPKTADQKNQTVKNVPSEMLEDYNGDLSI